MSWDASMYAGYWVPDPELPEAEALSNERGRR